MPASTRAKFNAPNCIAGIDFVHVGQTGECYVEAHLLLIGAAFNVSQFPSKTVRFCAIQVIV